MSVKMRSSLSTVISFVGFEEMPIENYVCISDS